MNAGWGMAMNPRWLYFLISCALCVHAGPVLAFGSIVTTVSNPGRGLVATRALVTRQDDGLIYQLVEVQFDFDATQDFAWVLPILAEGTIDFENCPADRNYFEELREIAEPRIHIRERQPHEGSCNCGEGAYAPPVLAEIGAHPSSSNTATPFDVEALEPFDTFDDLRSHLEAGNYVISTSAVGVLSHYVEHTYGYVIAEVAPEYTTGRVCLQIRYSFADDEAEEREGDYVLSLRAASIAATEEVEVFVYVLDEGMARPYLNTEEGVASFYSTQINLDGLRTTEAGGTNYSELFYDAVMSRPPRAFVVEYSGSIDRTLPWTGSTDRWLTRMRTIFERNDMESADLNLEVLGQDEVPSEYEILVASVGRPLNLFPFVSAIALVGVLLLRRRTRGGS